VAQGQRNLRIEVTMPASGPGGTAPAKLNPPATAAPAKLSAPAAAPTAETGRAEPATRPVVEPATAERPASIAERSTTEPSTAVARRFETRRPSLVPSYLMLASGVVGLGGYGVLTYWGRSDNAKLADCTPNCSPASVEHIRKLYLAANISLGVGVAALVTGVVLRMRNHSYQVEVHPSKGGAVATVSRAF
jgi:hypothetical protein